MSRPWLNGGPCRCRYCTDFEAVMLLALCGVWGRP